MAKRKLSADFILERSKQDRIDPDIERARFDERDARNAADTRTPAQVLLGDPPADPSALAPNFRRAFKPLGGARGSHQRLG